MANGNGNGRGRARADDLKDAPGRIGAAIEAVPRAGSRPAECRRMLMEPREFSSSDREAIYRVQAGEFTHWTFHR